MPSSDQLLIALREPSLDRHPFFELKPVSLQNWLDKLPRANLGETSRLLFVALRELNKVKCKAELRVELLELLRPMEHFVLKGMQKHYLNRPIPLAPEQTKVVELCNTLNLHLATGYCLAANALHQQTGRASDELLALATHRALAELNRTLLRYYQLYRDPKPRFWRTLHQLYGMALSHKVSQGRIKDPILGGCTVLQCYLRPLLLATANPHQLPQNKLQNLFDRLADWDQRLELRAGDNDGCVFVFNPADDAPPVYRELHQPKTGDIGIDTSALCEYLEQSLKGTIDIVGGLLDNNDIPAHLLQHLISSWSQMTSRNAPRVECEGELQVALGLYSSHFFIAGQIPFEDFSDSGLSTGAEPQESNPFLRKDKDVWSSAPSKDTFDRGARSSSARTDDLEVINFSSQQQRPTKGNARFRLYQTNIVNTSTSGYCVHWPSDQAANLKTGDVLALRELESPHWLLGALRWIRQIDKEHSQIGIELLSDAAEAFSAEVVQAGLARGTGHRALLIPENPTHRQPPRLLTARSVFKVGHTVHLHNSEGSQRVQLIEQLSYTQAFSLYMVKPLDNRKAETELDSGSDSIEFDSLWKRL